MVDHLHRPLLSNELVHHIDMNPHNNALSNLRIVSRREHYLIHFWQIRQGHMRHFVRRRMLRDYAFLWTGENGVFGLGFIAAMVASEVETRIGIEQARFAERTIAA